MKEYNESKIFMKEMFGAKPYAVAEIYGGEKYPDIRGEVDFYPIGNGVLVVSVLHNLPNTKTNSLDSIFTKIQNAREIFLLRVHISARANIQCIKAICL